MSHQLELPDELYDALDQAAKADGTTPIGWIASHLPKTKDAETDPGQGTLADLFKGRVGRIRSRGREALSEQCGQKFTDHLEQKRKEARDLSQTRKPVLRGAGGAEEQKENREVTPCGAIP